MALPPVYTHQALVFESASGIDSLLHVPDGFAWVLVDITGQINADRGHGVDFAVLLDGSVVISRTVYQQQRREIRWNGRAVALAALEFTTDDTCFCGLTATVYQLSLP